MSSAVSVDFEAIVILYVWPAIDKQKALACKQAIVQDPCTYIIRGNDGISISSTEYALLYPTTAFGEGFELLSF